MGFGVDTTCFLFATNDVSLSVTNGNGIDWKAFKAWKGVYPTFAGRYFGGGSSYKAGEFKSAYGTTGTDGALQYIFPIQASQGGGTGNYYGQSYYDVTGTTGYNYGVHDATQLCNTMANALATTELHVQSSGTGLVIVYLDVESGLAPLKSAYWAGWANTVHTYQLSGTTTKPFVPGIYCGYTTSGGKYVVPSDIQTVFDNAAKYWTHSNVRCRGLWTAEPEPCSYCTSGADVSADWGQFATTTQTLQTGTVEVPLYLWQYAEYGNVSSQTGGCVYPTTTIAGVKYFGCGPDSSFAGGQNLDLDGSDGRGGEAYMFKIVP